MNILLNFNILECTFATLILLLKKILCMMKNLDGIGIKAGKYPL